jgi:hypothetical protein
MARSIQPQILSDTAFPRVGSSLVKAYFAGICPSHIPTFNLALASSEPPESRGHDPTGPYSTDRAIPFAIVYPRIPIMNPHMSRAGFALGRSFRPGFSRHLLIAAGFKSVVTVANKTTLRSLLQQGFPTRGFSPPLLNRSRNPLCDPNSERATASRSVWRGGWQRWRGRRPSAAEYREQHSQPDETRRRNPASPKITTNPTANSRNDLRTRSHTHRISPIAEKSTTTQ